MKPADNADNPPTRLSAGFSCGNFSPNMGLQITRRQRRRPTHQGAGRNLLVYPCRQSAPFSIYMFYIYKLHKKPADNASAFCRRVQEVSACM